jgi:hypothetical protein
MKLYFRTLLILIICLVHLTSAFSQASSYGLVGSMGTYSTATGTTITGITGDDFGVGNLPIGFAFIYNGTNFSVFGASSNGFIELGGTSSYTSNSGAGWTPSTNALAGRANIIAPLWDDNNTTGGTVIYSTTGTAPNRMLTVQFTNLHIGGSGSPTSPTISMQIQLFETTNEIKFIYGSTSATFTSTTASIGISGVVGNYLSLTPISPSAPYATSSSTTENTVISSATNFPSGTIYTFTPPAPCTGTPIGGSVSPVAQNICPTAVPNQLSLAGYSTGSTGITFQWMSSTDGVMYANVTGGTGATTTTYTPPAFTGTKTWYKCNVTCTNSSLSSESTAATVDLPLPPTTQASSVGTSTLSGNTATITWTNGSGGNRYVVLNTVNSFTAPTTTASVTGNSAYNGGEQIVYAGTANSVSVTGLNPLTTYYVRVFEYLRCTAAPITNYYNAFTASGNPNSFGTLGPATTFSGAGNWSDASKWSAGVPACSSLSAMIASGASCTLDVNGSLGCPLTLNGKLLISGNSLNVGCTPGGGKLKFEIGTGGELDISSGSLTINGHFLQSSGIFKQSGGSITIDGNDQNIATNSVPFATHTFSITGGTVNCTGGTITIVDPPLSSSSSTRAISINLPTASASYFTGSHTFVLGDGSSTVVGNSDGFVVESFAGQRLYINHLTVNGGSDNGRWASTNNTTLSTAWGMNLRGTLTINSGSEFRANQTSNQVHQLSAHSIVNNGTFTTGRSTAPVWHIGTFDATFAPTTTSSISGNGVYRNLVNSPTAGFTNLTINNTNGVTMSGSVLNTVTYGGNISGTLTLTAGKVDVGNDALTLGINSTAVGTLSPAIPTASSFIVGELRRWISTTTGNRYFPIGTNTTPRFAQINFTGAQTTAGVVSAKFNATAPTSSGLPLLANAENGNIAIEQVSPSGYWTVNRISGAGGTYTALFDATGFTRVGGAAITDLGNVKLIKRPSGGSWALGATGTATNIINLNAIQRTGNTTFSDFALGGTTTALPVALKSFTAKALNKSNLVEWTTASERNTAWHIVERSKDGVNNWELVAKVAAAGTSTEEHAYRTEDKAPLALSYYRLRSVDTDGTEDRSNIILVSRKSGIFGVASVYPSPTSDYANVQFETIEEAPVTIQVFDFTCRLVLEQQMAAAKGLNIDTVNLTNLMSGVYSVQVLTETEISAQVKVVKQ